MTWEDVMSWDRNSSCVPLGYLATAVSGFFDQGAWARSLGGRTTSAQTAEKSVSSGAPSVANSYGY